MAGPQGKVLSPNLDLLRGFAVLCVFIAHLMAALGWPWLESLGRFGVVLFFVHTSFVLMASLERLEPTAASDRTLAIAFWVRRAFRIYPLSILFVLLTVLLHIPPEPDGTYQALGVKGVLANIALVQNLTYTPDILTPLWSLPLEVQMYVLLPLLYFVVRRPGRWRAALLWTVSVVLALVLPPVSGRLHIFLYAPCFTAGVVAYDLKRAGKSGRQLPSWIWPMTILAATALFGPFDDVSLPAKIVRAWVTSLGVGVLYASTSEIPCNWIAHVFQWIAEHSFGIYLSHLVILWWVIDRMNGVPLGWRITALAVSVVGVPALLYTIVEEPLIRVGGRVARQFLRPGPAQPGVQRLAGAVAEKGREPVAK